MLERLFPEDVRRAARAGRTFPLADFQEAAVTRARAVMRTRGGVVIADDVGLGKSYVALALVEEALCAGQEAALIVPASLRPMWRRLLSGLEGRERVHLATHTQLSRGSHPVGVARASLLVVDEAHAYRNPRTRRYRTLLELCAGARVAMLTATPVNNDPADLANLVRLFAADDAFRDVGVSSLRGLVRRQRAGRTGSAAGEARRSAGDVRRVAQHVVVRRTWELISGADDTVRVGGKALSLPRREPPEVVTYRDPWTPAAVRLIESLELGFQGAATGPRGGASDLLRLALLKRLDSGRAAIEVSLRRLLRLLERVRDGARAGVLVRPGDVVSGERDAMQLVLDALVLDRAPAGVDLDRIAASAARDAHRLSESLRTLAAMGRDDPKLTVLRALVAGRGPGEKVVVFTEYRDTAHAVWRALAPMGGVGRVDGSGAWLGHRPASRGAVLGRFSPAPAPDARPPAARERVDVLVATDVLSEGHGLQEARIVVCYDLPWNPVRLLQRIGRVARLGSRHPSIRTLLFLPGEGVEDVLRLTRRLRAKLHGIDATVGAEYVDELLRRLAPEAEDCGSRGPPWPSPTAAPDPLERLRELARECARPAPPTRRKAAHREDEPLLGVLNLPRDAAPGPSGPPAPEPPGQRVLALVTARSRAWLVEVDESGMARPAGERGAAWLHRALRKPEGAGTGRSHGSAVPSGAELRAVEKELARAMERARAFVAGELGAGEAPPPVAGGEAATRLARRVRRRVRSAGPGLDGGTARLADRVLGALASPGRWPPAHALKRLEAWSHGPAAARLPLRPFLEHLHTRLRPAPRPAEPLRAPAEPRVEAALLVGLQGG